MNNDSIKVFTSYVQSSQKFTKLFEWGKLVSLTGFVQITIQIIGLGSGIVIIRLLPPNEYALYTLANTMLGTMSLLSDGGISAGVMAQGGKVWQDREKLGVVLSTGFELRYRFARICLIIFLPVMLYLLKHHGASWPISILIILAIIPSFTAGLSGNLIQIAYRLAQDLNTTQKIHLYSNAVRVIFVIIGVIALPYSFTAIFIAGASQIWANIKLQKGVNSHADLSQKPDLIVRKEIVDIVKRILPGTIYGCVFGQISVWLISIFGSTTEVAQVGALGRLAMLLTIFSTLFSTLITPRFARLHDDKKLILSRYIQIHIGLLLIGISIVTLVWMFIPKILLILGKEYIHLETEALLCIIGACINFVASSSFILYTSRGWVMSPFVTILISIMSVCCGAFLFNTSTLEGVLLLNIFVGSIQIIMEMMFGFMKFKYVK